MMVHSYISIEVQELVLEVSNHKLRPVQMTNLEEAIEGSQDINWIFSPPPFPAKRVSVMHKKTANTPDIILQRISERAVRARNKAVQI